MKLVLLPGLDGTGNLYTGLIAQLPDYDCTVIPLPQSGAQSYVAVTQSIKRMLPDEAFILLAESFAGPIAALLASEENPNLKGVVFVATFLSPPNRYLLASARRLPIKSLLRLPFARYFYQPLFFGADVDDDLVELFEETVRSLPERLIKERLDAIHTLDLDLSPVGLPVTYLQAASDMLVPASKALEFRKYFNKVTVKAIEGPHFLLQANPCESAVAISEWVNLFVQSSD